MHRPLLTAFLSLVLCNCIAQLTHKEGVIADSIKRKIISLNPTALPGYQQLFAKKMSLKTMTIESSSLYNRGLFTNDLLTTDRYFGYSNHTRLGIEVLGLPFNITHSYRTSVPFNMNDSRQHWYTFSMDVQKYRQKWKELASQLQPESLTKSGAALNALKQGFSERVTKEIRAQVKTNRVLDSITGTLDPSIVAERSTEELSVLYFGKDVGQSAETAENKLNELQSAEGKDKDSLVGVWKGRLEDAKSKMAYLEKIREVATRYKTAGVLKEMHSLKEKSKAEYDDLMKNPEKLMHAMGVKSGTGWMKLLSRLSQFKAGGQSLPFAASAGVPALANGITAEINIGNKYLAFSTGKIIPSYQEYFGAEGPQPAKNPSYWFINFRDGKESGPHKGFKLTGISGEQPNVYMSQPAGIAKNNTLLANVYAKERIAGNNWLSAEISKTITEGEQNVFDLSNASVKLKLDGRLENAGITHSAHYSRLMGTNNGFTEHYLYSNGYEAGFSLRYNKQQKKLAGYARGNTRNFRMAGSSSFWNNKDVRAGVSYKLKRNQRLQLHLFSREGNKQYNMNSSVQVIRQQSKGLSADLSLVNKRIFGLYNTSFISAGVQHDIFPMQYLQGNDKTSSYSTTWNFLLNQSFIQGENVIQFNAMYSKVEQALDAFFYNSKLDIEGGYIFKAGKHVTAGASFVYGYFKNAYENVGFKPSLSATIGKHFMIDTYADVRINTRTLNPLFNQFINLGCDLRYTLK